MAYKQCSIDGCLKNSVAKGLCDLHYRRQRHHGTLEQTRPADWGAREKHPLYQRWTWMRRSYNGGLDDRWKDFWQFVKDVGSPSSEIHTISRLDTGEKFGPKNFFWREKIVLRERTETQKEYARRYQEIYRKENPEKMRRHDLRKKYGIGVEEYDALLEKQGGVCAICKKDEQHSDMRSGNRFRLAVDHCHNSKAVRGLLCSNCNKGIGHFGEDVELMRAAILYLQSK